MALDLTGIANENEFYTHHYLTVLLENDLKGLFTAWEEREAKEGVKPPQDQLARLNRNYFTLRKTMERLHTIEEILPCQREFFTTLLESLGYAYEPALKELDSGSLFPVIGEVRKKDGAPELWIVEAAAPLTDDPDPLDVPLTATQYGDTDAAQMLLEIPLSDLMTKQVFTQTEPPRWVLILGFSHLILLDRSKWNERRYLRFDLSEILGRRVPSTLKATAALLHRESVCPEEGTSLLDTLDENSHKHAFAVSEDLKYSAREAVELLGNEAIFYIRQKRKEGVFGDRGGEALDADILPQERLKLPWITPSAPWWPLKGPWSYRHSGDEGKTLIFSRFRAVPQAIASLMSYNLEADLLSTDSGLNYEDLTKRRSLQPKAGNVALLGHFYPSIFLVTNTDPIANGIGSLKVARETVAKQLRKVLRDMGICVRSGSQRRSAWYLIAALERKQIGSIEDVDSILKDWEVLHVSGVSRNRTETETNFSRMLKSWRKASEDEISEITPAEVDDLAKYALSAPGVVVGRALYRHWSGAMEGKGFIKCIEVSWKGLRNYLSSRLFVKALSGSETRYPEAIRKAALEGNLESVLDEHLWIASKIGGSTGEQLANELLEALKVRTSNFYMHSLGNKRKRFSLRCHAVMPFTDPRAETSSTQPFEDGEKPIRADELRKAFNTPFWPHVLATTSVGQEGLDFHVWCETLLHWDLCSNPVDLEQREGRIRRYGGLAIRRKVAQLLWNNKMRIESFTSPWAKLERIAEKKYADDSGLSPWWICKGADVKRLVINLPASDQNQRLEMLKQQRLLYRLALGQPNQEDLLEVLRDKYRDKKDLNNIGLNLSAFVRKAKAPGEVL